MLNLNVSDSAKSSPVLGASVERAEKLVNVVKLNPVQKALINALVLLLVSAPAFASGGAYGELYTKLPQLRGARSTTEIKKILTDNYSSVPQGVLELVRTTRSSTFRRQFDAFYREMGTAPVSAALRQCSSDPGGGHQRGGDFRAKLSSDFAKAAAALMQCSSDPGGGGQYLESAGALRQCSSDPGGGHQRGGDFRAKLSSDFAKSAEALMQCSSDPGGGGQYLESAGALRQCSSDPGGGQKGATQYQAGLLSNFAKEAEALMGGSGDPAISDVPAPEPVMIPEGAGALRQCSSDPGGERGADLRADMDSGFAKAAAALMQRSSDSAARQQLEADFAKAGLAFFHAERGGSGR